MAAALALPPPAMAQTTAQMSAEPEYSAAHKACIQKTQYVDYEIAQCDNAERERQDKVLNETYRKLTAATEAKYKPALLKAQRTWLAFRDAQCDLEYAPEATGTDGRVVYSGCMLRFTYERVETLKRLLSVADDGR
jgi:uncharacterized protein YecT (DUF1311 family)